MESRRMTEMLRLHARTDPTLKDIVESHQRHDNERKSRHSGDYQEQTLTEEQVKLKDTLVMELLEEHHADRPLSFGK
jgi:hypothetical protein